MHAYGYAHEAEQIKGVLQDTGISRNHVAMVIFLNETLTTTYTRPYPQLSLRQTMPSPLLVQREREAKPYPDIHTCYMRMPKMDLNGLD